MNFPSPQGWILRVEISSGLFLSLIKHAQQSIKTGIFILNRRGDVFDHPARMFPGDLPVMGLVTDRWDEIKKADGNLLSFRFKGKKMMGVFMPLEPFGLIIGTVFPASAITHEVFNSMAVLCGMGLIALMLLAAVNYWMLLLFVIYPLENIASRISDFTLGEEETVLPSSLGRGSREFAVLVNRFNLMSRRIHIQIREIARLESMLRNILDSSPAIVVALDTEGKIWYINRAGETFFSISRRNVLGKELHDLNPMLEDYERRIQEVSKTSKPQFFRAQNWLRGGMVDSSIYPLVANGIEGVVVQWIDVTKKFKAREVYRKRLEEIFSKMDDIIYVMDEDYRLELVNEKTSRHVGKSAEDIIGHYCYEVIKGRKSVCPECRFGEIKEGKVVKDRIISDIDGRYYDVLSIPLVNDDGKVSKLTVLRDVTKHIAIHEALKSSEKAFRALFERAPVGMSVHRNGKFVMVNAALGEILGYDPQELIGASIFTVLHPDDKEFVKERLKRISQEGKPVEVAREKYMRKDGSIAEVLVTGIPIVYQGEQSVHTVVVDMSEQIRLETSLLRSEVFSAQILEKSLDPILIMDTETEIMEANYPASRFLGLPAEEIIGKNFLEFIDPVERKNTEETIGVLEKDGFASVMGRKLKVPSGEKIVNISLVRVKTPQGDARDVMFIKDLTEFVRLQQRLAQAQKQESLWQMAGGFAHDFNNLLAIMFGYLDMMELSRGNPEHDDYFMKLRDITIRARDLVQNILLYSRESQGNRRLCALKELFDTAVDLVKPTIGSNVELSVEVLHPKDTIFVDMTQMVQVILNLLINAKDAIGEDSNGMITVKTGRKELSKHVATLLGAQPGQYVEISISDTGGGIPEDIRHKVFDPFFTTKSKGARKGTGLGLAIVHSIVKNYGGHIDFDTSTAGTTFRVLIPLEKEGREIKYTQVNPSFVRGKGRVLIVEDEPMLRGLVGEMLERLGYEAGFAGDGLEAIEKLREMDLKWDLVVMDLAMPRMGGEEALAKMMEIHPEMKVVIMSGLVDPETQRRLLEKGAMAFIKKPVTISGLSQVIARVIQEQ